MKKKKPDEKTQHSDLRHQELEEQLKRALADYQNLERRVTEEKRLLSELYSAIIIEKFLPILDNLENAQKHLNDQGLAMVISQFNDVLIAEGVEEIKAEGQNFDPRIHEAVETIESEEDGKVAKVVSKGYKINDKVIRPVKVAVGKVNAKAQDTNNLDQPEQSNQEAIN